MSVPNNLGKIDSRCSIGFEMQVDGFRQRTHEENPQIKAWWDAGDGILSERSSKMSAESSYNCCDHFWDKFDKFEYRESWK